MVGKPEKGKFALQDGTQYKTRNINTIHYTHGIQEVSQISNQTNINYYAMLIKLIDYPESV